MPAVRAEGARNGSVLLLVLLGLLLLEIMIAGSLAVAGNAAVASSLAAHRLRARLLAESAIRETALESDGATLDTLAPGTIDRRTSNLIEGAAVDIEALGGGRFLLRARAPAAGISRTLAQALVSVLPRDSLLALFDAALHADGPVALDATAVVDGTGSAAPGPCAEPPAPGIVATVDGVARDPAAVVVGAPDIAPHLSTRGTTVAGIPFASLRGLADHELAGSVTPSADACDPLVPCDDPVPFIVAPAGLTLAGGAAHGFLLVLGRLRIDGGARFHGAVLARSIELADGAVIGSVRTFGADTSRIAGALLRDTCAVLRSVAAPALRRPFRFGPRLWLPAR